MRKFAAALRRYAGNAWSFAVAHPARARAFLLAFLAVAAGFIPGLPIDAIDSLFAAALIVAGGEGVKAVSKTK